LPVAYNHISSKHAQIALNNQVDNISLYGKLITNFEGRYERISENWSTLCKILNIRVFLPISLKANHQHYTHYYDDETREFIAQKYKKDIEQFQYQFGK